MELYLGILLCTISVLVCVWMFVRRRQGDEPFCRKCGFCLAGLTEPGVCPECGRGLDRKRAVVIGEARTKRRPVFVSLGLAIAGVLLVVVDGLGMRGVFPVVQYKPAWLLTAEAYLLGDRRASVATAEINSRTTAGTLDASWQDRLVRISLDRHAQTWRAFPDAQWQVIIEASSNRRLTTAQIRGVFHNIFEEGFVITDENEPLVFAPGDERVIRVGINYRAGGPLSQLGLIGWFLSTHTILKINERPDVRQGREQLGSYTAFDSSLWTGSPVVYDSQEYVKVNTPWVEGVYTGTAEVFLSTSGALVLASDYESGGPSAASEYVVCNVPVEFEVAKRDDQRFPVLDAASQPGGASSCVQLRPGSPYPGRNSTGPVAHDYYVELKQDTGIDWSETALAGHVVLRQGDSVVYKLVEQPHRQTQHILLDLQSLLLDSFEPGEVRVTYEHNEAFASWCYRFEWFKFKQILGGPIELGTIELPGKK